MLPNENQTIMVGSTEVILDVSRTTFDEATLNKFLQESASWYNYYGQQLADAEGYLQWSETSYDKIYSEQFRLCKEDGGSDKLAESKAKAATEVMDAKKKIIACKRAVKKLQLFLKSLDKAHDNAMSYGHMLRREMDKIQPTIRRSSSCDQDLDKMVDDIIKPAHALD